MQLLGLCEAQASLLGGHTDRQAGAASKCHQSAAELAVQLLPLQMRHVSLQLCHHALLSSAEGRVHVQVHSSCICTFGQHMMAGHRTPPWPVPSPCDIAQQPPLLDCGRPIKHSNITSTRCVTGQVSLLGLLYPLFSAHSLLTQELRYTIREAYMRCLGARIRSMSLSHAGRVTA